MPKRGPLKQTEVSKMVDELNRQRRTYSKATSTSRAAALYKILCKFAAAIVEAGDAVSWSKKPLYPNMLNLTIFVQGDRKVVVSIFDPPKSAFILDPFVTILRSGATSQPPAIHAEGSDIDEAISPVLSRLLNEVAVARADSTNSADEATVTVPGWWGTGIFDGDDACAVRSHFSRGLADYLPPERAADLTITRYEEICSQCEEDQAMLYLALASLLLGCGVTQHPVMDEALRIIAEGIGLSVWKDAGEEAYNKRRGEYRRLGSWISENR